VCGEENMQKCQNHALLWVFNIARHLSAMFNSDLTVLEEMCSFVAGNGNVSTVLRRYQHTNSIASLAVLTGCDTRWEATKLQVGRVLQLIASLPILLEIDTIRALKAKVGDFLLPTYFEQLQNYYKLLCIANDVSLLYQTQRFPTGCLVPVAIQFLVNSFTKTGMEGVYLAEYMDAFLNGLTQRMVQPIIQRKNNFLLSALMHPGVAAFLGRSGCVSNNVLEQCWSAIEVEALLLVEAEERETHKVFVSASLTVYKALIPTGDLPLIDINDLKSSGTYFGVSHMLFWQSVVLKKHPKHDKLSHLVPVASMLLAQPSGESVDEFAFSSACRTLTCDRNSLVPTTVEQITIIRMFVKEFNWSHLELDKYVQEALEQHLAEKKVTE
jgi:hypothetical protein